MNKKTIFIILLFFLLQHCGYSPIYTNVKNLDFNLNVKNISGNNDINNLIKIYIQQYSNKSGNKNLDLNIKTEYVKSVLSKNKEGKITNFLIKSKIEFELISLEDNKNYVFQEETRAASMDDQFEFKKYENTIKRNFVNSAIEQLILKITTTQ